MYFWHKSFKINLFGEFFQTFSLEITFWEACFNTIMQKSLLGYILKNK